MKLSFRRDVIKSVRERWREQYRNWPPERKFVDGRTVGEISAAIDALELATCTAEDVERTLNACWAAHECDECKANYEVLVHIGQEPDYEARYQLLCHGCLTKATALAALYGKSGQ